MSMASHSMKPRVTKFNENDVMYFLSDGVKDRPIEDRWLSLWIIEFSIVLEDDGKYEGRNRAIVVRW